MTLRGVADFEGADGVDQDVRGADGGGDSIHQRLRHGGVGGVGDLAVYPIWEPLQPGLVAIYSDDCEPGAVKPEGGGLAEPAAGTGHDDDRNGHGMHTLSRKRRGLTRHGTACASNKTRTRV